jgi:hypothetical protein
MSTGKEQAMRRATTYQRALTATAAVLIGLGLSACGSGGEAATNESAIQVVTTAPAATSEQPQPITTAELAWLRAVKRYDRRLVGGMEGTSVLTRSALVRSIALDDACSRTLRRAGDAGRLHRAQTMVRRACQVLHRAANDLRRALATGLISGAIIDSSTDIDRFSSWINAGFKEEGDATEILARALASATKVKDSLGTA